MKRRVVLVFVSGLLLLLALSKWRASDAQVTATSAGDQAPKSMFGQFVGVCQASADPARPKLWSNISFIRNDLSWGALQPNSGEDWNQEYLDNWGKQVLANRQQGVEILPIFDYMVP